MDGRQSTAPAAPGSRVLAVGDVLDSRYRITGVLGSGGMGRVYRAEHVAIQRPVALKLLHPDVEELDGIPQRFEREAFAIGRVDHPNCVSVSDFGRLADGTLYMALEVLDGISLFELLERKRKLPWRRSLRIARHVLRALAHAHDAGIVHRDVKPENVILVDQDGDTDFAKILDFGIAKLFDKAQAQAGGPGLTQLGVIVGTPTYMAPEQAFGQPLDGRADLYSLSVMLFEMITGVPPFDADDAVALLTKHATAEVPAIADVDCATRVPDSVEKLIRQGLQKKPEQRMASASAFLEAIDAILERGSDAPSAVDGAVGPSAGGLGTFVDQMRTGAEGFRESLAPAMARAVESVRSLPTKRSRVELFALVAAVMITCAMLVAAFARSGPDYLPSRSRIPLLPPKHGPEAEAAAQMLEQGQPKQAAAYLTKNKREVGEDPYAQLVLGHAHATAQRNLAALGAYERAVALEPDLAKDKLLRTNLDLMLQKREPRVVEASVDLLASLVRVAGDHDAADDIVKMASSHEMLRARHHAMEVADELGLGARIDHLGAYVLDLRQGPMCADRRDAVAKLRALGDKRAIPALKRAKKRIITEGLLNRKTNINACLRRDAVEAIQYLESL
jgi:hypothetical protein